MGVSFIPSPSVTYRAPEPVVKSYTREGLVSLIQETFPNDPIMLCIADKESNTAQFWASGDRIPVGQKVGDPKISGTQDVGVLQINQVHWPEAERLGLDVKNSVEDNLAMAKIVKSRQGYKAWATYPKCYNHLAQQGN